MRIKWLREAADDLTEIRHFIAEDNPHAAQRIAELILNTLSYLMDHPEIGRPGRVPGTRELVIPGTPYLVPYRVRNAVIEILAVLHGAQKWPQ